MRDNVPQIALCISLVLAFMCDAPITQAQTTLASLKADSMELAAVKDLAEQIQLNNPALLPVRGE
jgi:hypothetical protein